MKILVSVIVPVYNAEKFLDRCIESIRKQTLKEIEMIFINDGSIDSSLEILSKYEKIDDRIRVISQVNSGPSAARNRGIKVAKGEYITFVDADDYLELDMYEKMYNEAYKNKAELVISDFWINKDIKQHIRVIENGLQKYDKEEINNIIINKLLTNSNLSSLWNKLFRRDVIINNNIMLDENVFYAEDWLFVFNFYLKINNIAYINEPLYNYVRGHDSLSNSYGKDTFEVTGLWIYRKRKEFAKKLNYDEYIGVRSLYNVIMHCIISELRRKDINLKIKFKNISDIIDSDECTEVISNIDLNSLGIKEKFIYYAIKYKFILVIQLYVLLGKVKEKYLI